MMLTIQDICAAGPCGSLRRLAENCDVSVTLLSLINKGERALTLELAKRIADVTQCEVVLANGEIRFEVEPDTPFARLWKKFKKTRLNPASK